MDLKEEGAVVAREEEAQAKSSDEKEAKPADDGGNSSSPTQPQTQKGSEKTFAGIAKRSPTVTDSGSRFSHPAYERVSVANGIVNKMSVETLRLKLGELTLSTRGSKQILQKRLKTCLKEQILAEADVTEKEDRVPIDYFIVIDVEATCEEDRPEGYLHEIIEFPALLLNARTLSVESEFWSYCRPKINPKLSEFCTKLTGIEQYKVDVAPSFPVVLDRFDTWLEQNVGPYKTFTIATDGPWDINRFFQKQCKAINLKMPHFFNKWVNIRKLYYNFYKVKNLNLEQMLEHLGMTFEGRQHSGIDDTRNIARILVQLIRDGCDVRINDFLKKDFV